MYVYMYRTLYKNKSDGYAFCLEFQEEDRCRIENTPFSTNFSFQNFIKGGTLMPKIKFFLKHVEMHF